MSLIGRIRSWWPGTAADSISGESFTIACNCGQTIAGIRQRRSQQLVCPACGLRAFVLPASPWLTPPTARAPVGFVFTGSAADWRWRIPVVAAVLTATVVVVAFCLVLPRIGRNIPREPARDAESLAFAAEDGKRALAEGNFFQAERQLAAALPANGRDAASLEYREIDQLRRQAALLSRLHGASLEEILGEALPLRSEEEWKERFRAEHSGKTVVFDDVINYDGRGRPALAVYRVRIGGEQARVALEDLHLLQRLPLNPPERVVFGARLIDLAREEGGGWAFRFDPDSAVLLTDEGAVAACLFRPDSDLLEVLRRQKQWIAELDRASGSH